MKVATWNINSIRMRLTRLVSWLERTKPDVVCLQETKVVDELFPRQELESVGYHCLFTGQKTYNGVAILSRTGAKEIFRSLPGDGLDGEKRILAADVEGMKIINIYAPNGSAVGSAKYEYKLDWYKRLRGLLDASFDPKDAVLICGDFNVAPEDRDVWDPEQWRGQILFSEPEKEALRNLMAWGFIDALRQKRSEAGIYTWWDYRAGAFHRGLGLRIDHVLTSAALAERCADVVVDREERKGEKPSDHAPVVAIFNHSM